MPRLKHLALLILTSTPARILDAFLLITAPIQGLQLLLRPFRWPNDAPLTAQALALHTLGAALIIAACVSLYALFTRLTERRWPAELRPTMPDVAAGIALGLGLSAATVGTLWSLGLYHIDDVAPRSQWAEMLLRGAISSTVVATLEETLFRAVIFRLTQRRLGSAWALAISSALFGFAHLFNPNATVLSSVAIAVQAGLLLGATYALTQRLWLPIALHAAWNFMQASVVGGALSGNTVHAILTAHLSGPTWLSGGEFGIEGSLPATLLCAAAAVAVLSLAHRRGRLVPRSWPEPTPRPATA